MLNIRYASERGVSQNSWLDSKHTFSFGFYLDRKYTGFGVLKVINDDKINPEQGFATHSHKNMEIISYVLEGALEHKDSLGNGSIIVPGDVQRMSAGSGISHSEFNPLTDKQVHLLQIWITPNVQNIKPSYEQKNFTTQRKEGKLTLLCSNNGRDDSLKIHQDLQFYVLDLGKGQSFVYQNNSNRMLWIQIARGGIKINNNPLLPGDGVSISQETAVNFTADEKSEILIFDMADNE